MAPLILGEEVDFVNRGIDRDIGGTWSVHVARSRAISFIKTNNLHRSYVCAQ